MKNWLNRHLTHNRDKVGDFGYRATLHFPIGLLIGLTFPFSYPLLRTFIAYEENEDIHTKDEAWKDYFGALVGMGVGVILLATLLLILWRL